MNWLKTSLTAEPQAFVPKISQELFEELLEESEAFSNGKNVSWEWIILSGAAAKFSTGKKDQKI